MLKQAIDFLEESQDIYELLSNISENSLDTATQFKHWSFNDIIRHLHVWNIAAYNSLQGDIKWETFNNSLQNFFKEGKKLSDFEKSITKNLKGKSLLNLWQSTFKNVSEEFKKESPKKRVKWVGPDMSVISSISARHMETWAHSQAIYDSIGKVRNNKDRILNIVIIGKNTFEWTYKVNNREIPTEKPYLKLISPSGKVWEFNDPSNKERIEGLAEEFCQVVTQVRNIKDVNLKLSGKISTEWMSNAQCFAGKASSPPLPGTRKLISQ